MATDDRLPMCTVGCGVLALVLLGGICSEGRADGFVLTFTPKPNNASPYIVMTAQAPQGDPPLNNLSMVIDTGSNVPGLFNAGIPITKYLIGGKVVPHNVIGGSADGVSGATLNNAVTLAFSPAPTVPAGQATKVTSMPATWDALPIKSADGLIGARWLNTFGTYGFYNDNKGVPRSMFLVMPAEIGTPAEAAARNAAAAIANRSNSGATTRPAGTQSATAVSILPQPDNDGTVHMDGGFEINLNISVPGEGTVSAPFLIKSGSEQTMIGPSLATTLGINTGALGQATFSGDFNDFVSPTTSASIDLFGGAPTFPMLSVPQVAVLDSLTDPDNLNILGSDVLSQLEYWEISPNAGGSTATFRAAVPEPTGIMLAASALATILALHLSVPKTRSALLWRTYVDGDWAPPVDTSSIWI